MVYSRVQFLLGDILEPEVTCQRTFVRFHTMFSIMKTMTKYLLGSTLNRDTNFYENRHFLRQKWTEIRFWSGLNK